MAVDWESWKLSYLPDTFGPLYGAGSVKQAMVRTLQLWLPSYIAEINRQLGAPILCDPTDYLYQPNERPVAPDDAQVMVTVPGTIGKPQRLTEGYRTTFDARVTLFFGGTQDWNESEAMAQAYAAAVMAAVGQNPSLGNFAAATLWSGMQLGMEERSSTLFRVNCINRFSVVVANVMSPYGGIPTPSLETPADLPEVSSEHVTLTMEANAYSGRLVRP